MRRASAPYVHVKQHVFCFNAELACPPFPPALYDAVDLRSLHDLPLGADTRLEVAAMTLEVSYDGVGGGGLGSAYLDTHAWPQVSKDRGKNQPEKARIKEKYTINVLEGRHSLE